MKERECVSLIKLIPFADHKRPSTFKSLNSDVNNATNSYATNFGGSGAGGGGVGGSGAGTNSGSEAQVVGAVFKSLISRCVQSFKELKCQENIALYSDVRQLITFVKNTHGGVFRRVALSGIIDVTSKGNKKAYDLQTTRVVR